MFLLFKEASLRPELQAVPTIDLISLMKLLILRKLPEKLDIPNYPAENVPKIQLSNCHCADGSLLCVLIAVQQRGLPQWESPEEVPGEKPIAIFTIR